MVGAKLLLSCDELLLALLLQIPLFLAGRKGTSVNGVAAGRQWLWLRLRKVRGRGCSAHSNAGSSVPAFLRPTANGVHVAGALFDVVEFNGEAEACRSPRRDSKSSMESRRWLVSITARRQSRLVLREEGEGERVDAGEDGGDAGEEWGFLGVGWRPPLLFSAIVASGLVDGRRLRF